MLHKIKPFYSPQETRYLTHNIHPYPHKFIPQIAKILIGHYSQKGDTILDPFCGSGTCLLEASLLQRHTIGIDINPLACLISKVKTNPLPIKEVRALIKELHDRIYRRIQKKETLYDHFDSHPNIPSIPKREKWFQNNVLRELAIIKESLPEQFNDFFRVAFSDILKEVSNASSSYRLTRLKKPKRIPSFGVLQKFIEKCNTMLRSIEQLYYSTSTTIYERDSRVPFPIKKVDLILSNPPKFSFDYRRWLKIYSWWLDFNFKKIDFIGQNSFEQYYADMKTVFTNMYNIIKERKYCVIQCSDFVFQGTLIRHADMFCQIAKRIGFTVEKRIPRIIPKKVFIYAKEDKIEEILVLRK
jgi:DNA modification methylase